MTAPNAGLAPPEPAPDADAFELLDHAERLLEHHDEQEDPREAARSWTRCHGVLLRARDTLERQGPLADPAALARARFLLGLTLSMGYWQAATGEGAAYAVDDPVALRRTAADLLALSRATLPETDPSYAAACVRLALLLHDRYENPDDPDGAGVPDDLDEAIAAFAEGLALPAAEDAHPGLVVTRACALADRYDRDRDPADLRDAASRLEELLDEIRPSGWAPPADGTRSWADEADELELEARIRLVRLLHGASEDADGERAVHHLELIAATAPDDHPGRVFAGGHLLDLYRERGGGRARPEDQSAYLARLRDLHRLLDPGEPDRAQVAVLLGAALTENSPWAVPDGSVAAPEKTEAVGLVREGLAQLPADDDQVPYAHALLGTLLNGLHEREPERYDIEEAARHLERAAELCSADDPIRGELLGQLAHANLAGDRLDGDLAGIDRTIGLLNEAMRTPSESPDVVSQTHGAYAAALSQRHALSHSADDLDAAIRHLTAAFRATPVGHVNRIVYLQNLAIALYKRYLTGGDLQDLHTAHRYLHEVTAAMDHGMAAPMDLHLVERDRVFVEHGLAQFQFMLALTSGDTDLMAEAVAALSRLRDSVGPDDPRRPPIDADYGLTLLLHAFHGGSAQGGRDGLVLMIDAVDALAEDHPDRPRLMLRTAGALMMTSAARYQAGALEAAEKMLIETRAIVAPESQEGLRASALYAALLLARFRYTGAPVDADRAVEVARAARALVRHRAPTPLSVGFGQVITDALRARSGPGDGAAAREMGLASLREAATVVLLQAAAEPALQMARDSADRALRIAWWCLADGDLPGTVEALELGRGQVLHTSTTTSDVPALLREAGRDDLAEEWEGGPRGPSPVTVSDLGKLLGEAGSLLGALGEDTAPPLPDDLRQRALTALAASDAGTALMTPPTPDQIAGALRAAGAHALVYLLPPGGAGLLSAEVGGCGVAMILTHDGQLDRLDFGLLRRQGLEVLETYREAHRHRQRTLESLPAEAPEQKVAEDRWRTALEELCDWAGPVVMGPLARSPLIRAAGPDPALVLVPLGELGGIPWHAALLSSGLRRGGRPVRAVERLTLSYAASARQFQEVISRPRLPLDAHPVIVGNPDDTLLGAVTEARQIHDRHYRQGLLLGRVRKAAGPGTPAEILAALPGRERAGASVLHLACHARPSGTSPLDAHLRLAAPEDGDGSGNLSIREILRQARGRPHDAPGGLVVLDACVSDHTAGDFDEALTLSTAFLAAGATGVVGSRWEVPDGLTGLLMYVFHDRLRAGAPPVRALREAQLWLLDPDREIPDGMPLAIQDIFNDGDPTGLEVWAAFACQGH
ncbi:CHAT domain-containing protein [Streptomyces sp. NPDC005799]|uniref:CHAT domain-containing tetratricopeptide repeat protein n=1 Tax=Streptomyces sp. NPDC005799 TaxID=3154678 RepID=UPI0033C69B66